MHTFNKTTTNTIALMPLVLCEYSKFRIESNSQLLFNFIRNQSNYLKFLNINLNVIYTRKELCLSNKMWLSAALLLTMVLSLEVFILGHYGPSSTGRIQQLAYNTNLKQGATKLLKLLNKYLLMVTFENGKNYLTQFEILNNGPIIDSIRNEKLFAQH